MRSGGHHPIGVHHRFQMVNSPPDCSVDHLDADPVDGVQKHPERLELRPQRQRLLNHFEVLHLVLVATGCGHHASARAAFSESSSCASSWRHNWAARVIGSDIRTRVWRSRTLAYGSPRR